MELVQVIGALVLVAAALLLVRNLRVRGAEAEVDAALGTATASGGTVHGGALDGADGPSERFGAGLAAFTSTAFGRDSVLARSLDRKAHRAGLSGEWSTERLVAAKLVGTLLGGGLGLLLVVAEPNRLTALAFLLFTVMGFSAVDVILSRRADQNRQAVERSLPDILDQLTICVSAGLGLEGAIARVAATNGDDPLGAELGKVLRDLRVGMTRTEALNALAERVDLPELRTVVRSVIQSDRAGVPVGRVLRVQAEEVRERRRVRAEERAMKMPVKLVFPLMLCVLPALFVVVIGPAALRIADANITGG